MTDYTPHNVHNVSLQESGIYILDEEANVINDENDAGLEDE